MVLCVSLEMNLEVSEFAVWKTNSITLISSMEAATIFFIVPLSFLLCAGTPFKRLLSGFAQHNRYEL